MPLLLAAFVIFFRSIGVLTQIGKFLEYATIAFSVNLDMVGRASWHTFFIITNLIHRFLVNFL